MTRFLPKHSWAVGYPQLYLGLALFNSPIFLMVTVIPHLEGDSPNKNPSGAQGACCPVPLSPLRTLAQRKLAAGPALLDPSWTPGPHLKQTSRRDVTSQIGSWWFMVKFIGASWYIIPCVYIQILS